MKSDANSIIRGTWYDWGQKCPDCERIYATTGATVAGPWHIGYPTLCGKGFMDGPDD